MTNPNLTPQPAAVIEAAKASLSPGTDPRREQRVLDIANLTGLRFDNGKFRRANFERGALLDALTRTLRPANILELGTGRGLGAFVMAAAAKDAGCGTTILTLDILPTDAPQDWPIEINGRQERRKASRKEIWETHLPADLRGTITEYCGATTTLLPRLLRENKRFDFIFIDAGHDLFSVVHDLAYCAQLLTRGGWILMDDFAPASEYGVGTCIVSTHARRLFTAVEVLTTEGTLYGEEELPGLPRSMVLLGDRVDNLAFSKTKLFFWRIASRFLEACYKPNLFPLGGHRSRDAVDPK